MESRCIKCKSKEKFENFDFCLDCVFDIAKETKILDEEKIIVTKEEYISSVTNFNNETKHYIKKIIISVGVILSIFICYIGLQIGKFYRIYDLNEYFILLSIMILGILCKCMKAIKNTISDLKKHNDSFCEIKNKILSDKNQLYKEKQKEYLSKLIKFYNYCKEKYNRNLKTIDDNSLKIISRSYDNFKLEDARKMIDDGYIIDLEMNICKNNLKKDEENLKKDEETKEFNKIKEVYNRVLNAEEPMDIHKINDYEDMYDLKDIFYFNSEKMVIDYYSKRMVDEEKSMKIFDLIEFEERLEFTEANNIEIKVKIYFNKKKEEIKIFDSLATINGVCKVLLYENNKEVGHGHLFLYRDFQYKWMLTMTGTKLCKRTQTILCKLNKDIENLNNLEIKYIPERIWLVEDI